MSDLQIIREQLDTAARYYNTSSEAAQEIREATPRGACTELVTSTISLHERLGRIAAAAQQLDDMVVAALEQQRKTHELAGSIRSVTADDILRVSFGCASNAEYAFAAQDPVLEAASPCNENVSIMAASGSMIAETMPGLSESIRALRRHSGEVYEGTGNVHDMLVQIRGAMAGVVETSRLAPDDFAGCVNDAKLTTQHAAAVHGQSGTIIDCAEAFQEAETAYVQSIGAAE